MLYNIICLFRKPYFLPQTESFPVKSKVLLLEDCWVLWNVRTTRKAAEFFWKHMGILPSISFINKSPTHNSSVMAEQSKVIQVWSVFTSWALLYDVKYGLYPPSRGGNTWVFFPPHIKHIRLKLSRWHIAQNLEISFYGRFIRKRGLVVTGLQMQKLAVILPFWQTCPTSHCEAQW